MKKKTINFLLLKKKISKNRSIKEISSLTKEEKKNVDLTKSLQDLLKSNISKVGKLMSSGDLKNFSKFQNVIYRRMDISKSREIFLKKEIKNKMTELSRIKKQEEIVHEKIKNKLKISKEEKENKEQIVIINKIT